jgi:hypothetical protein
MEFFDGIGFNEEKVFVIKQAKNDWSEILGKFTKNKVGMFLFQLLFCIID